MIGMNSPTLPPVTLTDDSMRLCAMLLAVASDPAGTKARLDELSAATATLRTAIDEHAGVSHRLRRLRRRKMPWQPKSRTRWRARSLLRTRRLPSTWRHLRMRPGPRLSTIARLSLRSASRSTKPE